MRTYDLEGLAENGEYHVVTMANEIKGNDLNFSIKMKSIEKWADRHCSGKYIILLKSVIFADEADALIFKLKYG